MSEAVKYINPIIQSWMHVNKNLRDSEEAKAQQQIQREAQAQADKHFQATHDLEKSRFEAEQKYREAQQLLNSAHMKAQGAQQTIENVGSGAVSPTETVDNSGAMSNGLVQSGAANFPEGLISHNTPQIDQDVLNKFTTATAPNSFDGSSVNVPTPAQIGANKLKITDPVAQRQNKQALDLEAAKVEGENQKIKAQGKNALDVANVNAGSRKYASDQSYNGVINAAQINAASRIKAAMVKDGKEKADTSYLAPEIANGTYSVEDLQKVGVKPEERVKLIGDLSRSGVKPLSKEQKAFAAAGGAITSFREALQGLNEAYQKHGMLSGFSTDVKNAKQEVTAQLGNIARVIGGERGAISNKDTERALGLAPNTLNAIIDGNANTLKLDQFDKILDNRFNTLFGNLKDEQKNLVRETWKIPTSVKSKSTEGTRLRNGEVVDASGTVTGRWK